MQIFVGLIAEGSTDYKFLEPVIAKVFIEIAFDCKVQIDITVTKIDSLRGESFVEFVSNASRKGWEEYGISILVIHADADSHTNSNTYTYKIEPATTHLAMQDENYCKIIVPLVPIQETESWMLADKDFFRSAINTRKNEVDLGIIGDPESFTDPKARITEAIRIGRADMPRKIRDSLNISDLYGLIGQGMNLDRLEALTSFQDFKNKIRDSFRELKLLI